MLACLPASANSAKILSGGALMTRSTLTVLPSIRQLKRHPMCRATTSHFGPVAVGSCSTRQAMAWIRSPRLYVPKTSAASNSGVRVVSPGGLHAHPAQHRGGFRPGAGERPAGRQHRVDEAGCQQRPQLGRRTAAVDDFQHSAQRGVGEDRRRRIGGDIAGDMGAVCGCGLPRWPGARGVRRRNVACDDCRHCADVLDVAGRRLVLGDGHDCEGVARGASPAMVKGHSPTHRFEREPAGEWQTSVVRVIIAQSGPARTRARAQGPRAGGYGGLARPRLVATNRDE